MITKITIIASTIYSAITRSIPLLLSLVPSSHVLTQAQRTVARLIRGYLHDRGNAFNGLDAHFCTSGNTYPNCRLRGPNLAPYFDLPAIFTVNITDDDGRFPDVLVNGVGDSHRGAVFAQTEPTPD